MTQKGAPVKQKGNDRRPRRDDSDDESRTMKQVWSIFLNRKGEERERERVSMFEAQIAVNS